MRSLRYLNSVLTVIAVLLTLTLWTMWNSPGGEVLSTAQPANAQGSLNQVELQREIRDLMKQQNVELASLNKAVSSIDNTLRKKSIKVRNESD